MLARSLVRRSLTKLALALGVLFGAAPQALAQVTVSMSPQGGNVGTASSVTVDITFCSQSSGLLGASKLIMQDGVDVTDSFGRISTQAHSGNTNPGRGR